MNVEIKDPFLLSSVRPANLESYLRTGGWMPTFSTPGVFSIWVHSAVPEDHEVRVPLDSEASGYPQRIYEVLDELAAFEQRPQMRVFLDVRDWNCDAIRIGFEGRRNQEYPDLATEIETLESTRELLQAVASSTVEPQPWQGRRQLKKEAADYLAGLELSLFEEPLSVRVLGRLDPVLFAEGESEFVPFVRQVSLKFRDAFDYLDRLLRSSRAASENEWTSTIQNGISANLTDSLARLLGQAQSYGSSVEISLRLAACRAFDGRAIATWHFQRAHLYALREISEKLKTYVAGPDERVVFLVQDIKQAGRNRIITGTALIEDEARRIEMSVDDELVRLGEFAKEKNSAIECLGRLRRKPDSRKYQVLQPHDFRVLHGDDLDVEVLRRKMPPAQEKESQLPLYREKT